MGPALATASLQLPGLTSQADSGALGLDFVFNKLCKQICCVAGADSLGLYLSVSGSEAVLISKIGTPTFLWEGGA